MYAMEAAIEELSLQEKRNIQAVADKYGVGRSALSERFMEKHNQRLTLSAIKISDSVCDSGKKSPKRHRISRSKHRTRPRRRYNRSESSRVC
jgi:hypothetical protein